MKTQETGDAYFIALGGGSNIGAKMLLIVWPKEKLIAIFDCGIGMLAKNRNLDNIYLPDFAKFAELVKMHPDYEIVMFLTHAHQDHIGAVPLFKKIYPQAKIFATEPTRGITEVMCRDSIKIRRTEGLSEHYDEEDITQCLESMQVIRSMDWIDLGRGFAVRFEPADVTAGKFDGALGCRDGAGHDIEQRRFPGAVRPDH